MATKKDEYKNPHLDDEAEEQEEALEAPVLVHTLDWHGFQERLAEFQGMEIVDAERYEAWLIERLMLSISPLMYWRELEIQGIVRKKDGKDG